MNVKEKRQEKAKALRFKNEFDIIELEEFDRLLDGLPAEVWIR